MSSKKRSKKKGGKIDDLVTNTDITIIRNDRHFVHDLLLSPRNFMVVFGSLHMMAACHCIWIFGKNWWPICGALVILASVQIWFAKRNYVPFLRLWTFCSLVCAPVVCLSLWLFGGHFFDDHTTLVLFYCIMEFAMGCWSYYLLFRKPAKPIISKAVITEVADNHEEQQETKEIIEMGSAEATMRLLKDLKSISKKKPKELGFTVEPYEDEKTGMENIYIWKVSMFGFDEDTQLYRDLQKVKARGKEDKIILEVRFSGDYPYTPPFVRVIRPRFAFRTGHVTLGGSVCMEILTASGWNSKNDIENVLIQIRQAFIAGGARLDPYSAWDYSETEAWTAFHRAALTHGWKITGITANKFPKTIF